MVSFDPSFRSMLVKEVVEGEGALWTEGIISWLSINRITYQVNRIKFVDGAFHPCGGVSLRVEFQASG